MFSNYLGDQVVAATASNIPTQLQKLSPKDSLAKVIPKAIPALFYVATRNSKTGTVYLKVVNALKTAQQVSIDLKGISSVSSKGILVEMKADKPEDTNTIMEPQNIVPITSEVKGLARSFTRTFPAFSISVLQIETK